MAITHNLGFPRIGVKREMKKAVEAYWRGEIKADALEKQGKALRSAHWQLQKNAGIDHLPVGDFSWYDHVLETSLLFGIIPERFQRAHGQVDQDTLFCMARGKAPNGFEAVPCEMTKWFDTNYHYIVPEFSQHQKFKITSENLFNQIIEAQQQGYSAKPVLLGPLSLLWLGKENTDDFYKLDLLPQLIAAYQAVVERLQQLSTEWVQIDEPILVLDLPEEWKKAFTQCYQQLKFSKVKVLLATYFGGVQHAIDVIRTLPVHGLHIDLVRCPSQLAAVKDILKSDQVLSLGVIDGRNIWKADLNKAFQLLEVEAAELGDRLWIAPSCSLLHTPIDLNEEQRLDPEIKNWLAFAKQKLDEISYLAAGINFGRETIEGILEASNQVRNSRSVSNKIHQSEVKQRVKAIKPEDFSRNRKFSERSFLQRNKLGLPILPTTTIGSYPQTEEIRRIRSDYKLGKINQQSYEKLIKAEIQQAIKFQDEIGLDVYVHGESERNDMVEYFGELLHGFITSDNGWVQSYGSRCVKPPIIYGDVYRKQAMTVQWSQYAQSLTSAPVKGMLTGPVTILAWSFVRDDQPRFETANQIALALRDEVCDLEKAGINIIQIDEPAFREIMPLHRSDWQSYFDWAVNCFRLSASGVNDTTQIHSHMCYSEFNDIIAAIAALDADVITLESSRSNMELLRAFENFSYPNDIGPGVYDIHTPRIPTVADIELLLQKALRYVPIERLWVNPDCGLKTRAWNEVRASLLNLVTAAKNLRKTYVDRNFDAVKEIDTV